MTLPENIENLIKKLPDAEGARRFYENFAAEHPREIKKIGKSPGLLSDVLTIASFSPQLAHTLRQNPKYISWLKPAENFGEGSRKRRHSRISGAFRSDQFET